MAYLRSAPAIGVVVAEPLAKSPVILALRDTKIRMALDTPDSMNNVDVVVGPGQQHIPARTRTRSCILTLQDWVGTLMVHCGLPIHTCPARLGWYTLSPLCQQERDMPTPIVPR